jgi:hypothetical protein
LLKVALKHQKSSNHQIIILFFKKCSFSLPKHRGNGEHATRAPYNYLTHWATRALKIMKNHIKKPISVNINEANCNVYMPFILSNERV